MPLPKNIRPTKASKLKKEHTESKFASAIAMKMAINSFKVGCKSKNNMATKMRRCTSEMRNRDIEVTSDREPINIKLKTTATTGFSPNLK